MATTRIGIDKLKYTKGGVALRRINYNDAAIETFVPTRKQATVLRQSIDESTTVMRGTAIDVVMVVTDDLPMEIFENVPKAWERFPIRHVAELARERPEILKLYSKHNTTTTMNEDERGRFAAFVREVGGDAAGVDEEAAFSTSRNAHLVYGE